MPVKLEQRLLNLFEAHTHTEGGGRKERVGRKRKRERYGEGERQ